MAVLTKLVTPIRKAAPNSAHLWRRGTSLQTWRPRRRISRNSCRNPPLPWAACLTSMRAPSSLEVHWPLVSGKTRRPGRGWRGCGGGRLTGAGPGGAGKDRPYASVPALPSAAAARPGADRVGVAERQDAAAEQVRQFDLDDLCGRLVGPGISHQ